MTEIDPRRRAKTTLYKNADPTRVHAMPTELPQRRVAPPESTTEGRLFFAVAVLAMLVISAFMMAHPTAFAAS